MLLKYGSFLVLARIFFQALKDFKLLLSSIKKTIDSWRGRRPQQTSKRRQEASRHDVHPKGVQATVFHKLNDEGTRCGDDQEDHELGEVDCLAFILEPISSVFFEFQLTFILHIS